MQILIVKDSATKVPREVADLEAAHGLLERAMAIEVQGEDGAWRQLERPAAEAEAAPAPPPTHAASPAARKAPAKKAAAKAAPAKKRAR